MRFTKMHGLGNDYIFLNCMEGMPERPERVVRWLSDRHFGVGGDGVICVCPSEIGDFRMRMFNADGTEGQMCGNGMRCLGKYVYDRQMTDKRRLQIETASGIRMVELREENGEVVSVTVDMGSAEIGTMAKIFAEGKSFTGADVSMGNPHFVIPVSSLDGLDVTLFGAAIERHERFPAGVNVGFAELICRDRIALKVWERGSGETLACGTGACAAVAVLYSLGRLGPKVTVSLPGGELQVLFRERDRHLLMTGPAVIVFEGEVDQPDGDY